jgi:diguanylate cyclase (GGDEF)-like protein/PAS domain S-box-containing protein
MTETVLAQRRSRHLARALDEAQEAIAVSIARENEWCFEYLNRAFVELLGYEPGELLGRSWRSLYARETDLKEIVDLRIGLLTGQKVRGDILMRRKDGVVLLVSISATPFLAEGEDTRFAVATFRDVTHARHEERRLREQASVDALTGLRNRREFERLLQRAIEMTPVGDRAHVVMFIDLDGFKSINDTLGHDAGDRVLIAVGETLQRSLLPSDDVARWGGDEFAAVMYFCTPEQAAVRGQRFIEALASAPECRGVGASIGIVRIVSDATIATLMHHADRLVYEAKAAGRNRVMVDH